MSDEEKAIHDDFCSKIASAMNKITEAAKGITVVLDATKEALQEEQ